MKQPIVVRAIQTCLQTNKTVVISSWQKNGNIKSIDTHCPTLTAAMGMGGGHTPMIIWIEEISTTHELKIRGFGGNAEPKVD